MPTSKLHVETVNSINAPEITLRAIARHQECIRAERTPEDPPLDLDTLVATLRYPKSNLEEAYFLLWKDHEVIGLATINLPLIQNTHLAVTYLSVLPAYRRQGLGKRLMTEMHAYAQAKDRRILLTNASSRLPTGELVLRQVGAKLVMQQQFIQLDLSELEPDLLTHWIAEAEGKATEYKLWQNLGAYPTDRLGEIADLHDVMNSAPGGERDMQDQQTTPESLREQDEGMTVSGMQRLTSFVEHKPSTRLVAFSELYWDTKRATLLIQHATAVRPEHRRHSLGRWMKAANLQTALKINPSARFVRAGNTDTNLGMLRINEALGFKPWTVHMDWQIETDVLASYLTKTLTASSVSS